MKRNDFLLHFLHCKSYFHYTERLLSEKSFRPLQKDELYIPLCKVDLVSVDAEPDQIGHFT